MHAKLFKVCLSWQNQFSFCTLKCTHWLSSTRNVTQMAGTSQQRFVCTSFSYVSPYLLSIQHIILCDLHIHSTINQWINISRTFKCIILLFFILYLGLKIANLQCSLQRNTSISLESLVQKTLRARLWTSYLPWPTSLILWGLNRLGTTTP